VPRKPKATESQYLLVPHEAIFEAFAEKQPLRGDLELKDELQFPLGDPILLALRESFTLTYPRRLDFIEPKEMLSRIREVAAAALKPIGDVLTRLKLAPVGKFVQEDGAVTVFKVVIAPIEKVTTPLNPAHYFPADPVIVALREVLTLSFSEAYSERDYARVFAKIRKLAAKALIPYNDVLEYLEIEPVAKPKVFDPEQE
jgi:hypothetical protein